MSLLIAVYAGVTAALMCTVIITFVYQIMYLWAEAQNRDSDAAMSLDKSVSVGVWALRLMAFWCILTILLAVVR